MFCKIILPSNEIHKLPTVPKTYEDLHQIALRKFKGKIPDKFYFKYKDSDDELITLSSDEDFETAMITSEADQVKTLRIFLIPETALPNVNPNSYLPNLQPASQESFSTENFLEKSMKGKQSTREAVIQPYGKKPGEYLEGIEEYDLNRLVDQLPGNVDRSKKSQSHPAQIESHDDAGLNERRDIGYDGFNRQSGRDMLPFNSDQMNAISDMLEKKLKEKVEQRVHIAVNEIMGKISEDWRAKPVKKNPYTHNPLMSKSVVPQFGAKPLARSERNQHDMNEYFCVNCRKKIEDVKYTCLDCANYDCCDQCEEKVDHPHSLLKTRLNKKSRPSMDFSDVSSASQNLAAAVPQPSQESGIKYTGLMMANKSQSNGYYKMDESGPYSANKNMGNPLSAPGGNHLIRYANSMATIHMNDKSMGDSQTNPFQAKNSSLMWNNKGIGMTQSSTYTKKETPKPFETPGEKEAKKYKAAIVKPPIYDLINVRPGHIYRVEFTIKNTGTEVWPENIKLICINGVHKGTEQSLPALPPTEKFDVKLELKAPQEPNRYLSQWRLQYYDESTPKPFGSNLFIEINVAEDTKRKDKKIERDEERVPKSEKVEKVEKVEKAGKEQEVVAPIVVVEKEGPSSSDKEASKKVEKVASPGSGVKERVKPLAVIEEQPVIEVHEARERVKPSVQEEEPKGVALAPDATDKGGFTAEERRLMKDKKCSEVVLRHAQALHQIYPDNDMESQIDFVAECPIHLDINDIVMIYSTRVDSGFGMSG